VRFEVDEILKYITVCMAAIGAILGVINTWNSLDRQRVKLIVRPAQGIGPNRKSVITIDVINLSQFAVSIDEIGLRLVDGRRAVILDPMVNGKLLPQRVEARESICALLEVTAINPSAVRVAYAKTTCSEYVEGDSPALMQIRDGTSPLLKAN
jgi:hypothetical protein